MDSRPIGIFDSGLGGLTAFRELRRMLPGEDMIYFGDTGRVPYGGRSRETLLRYTTEALAFFSRQNCKRLLIACGTASTVLDSLPEDPALPVSGVLYAASRAAVSFSRNGKIGLIATQATVRSGAYAKIMHEIAPQVEVFSRACPLFVPIIEAGKIAPGDPVLTLVAKEYLAELKEAGIDTLILGCTHYPIIRDTIAAIMGEGVSLVDAGAASAGEVCQRLRSENALAPQDNGGKSTFYVSDFPENFAAVGSMFLGGRLEGQVIKAILSEKDEREA